MSNQVESKSTKGPHVLVFSENAVSFSQFASLLLAEGYQAVNADTFATTQLLAAAQFALVIFELPEKDETSAQLCTTLRELEIKVPFLIISASADIDFKEFCLKSGADDFLTSPFEPRELFARLRALLKRPRNIHTNIIKVESLSLDTERGILSLVGQTELLQLRPKEAALLEFFMRRPSQVFSPRHLLDSIWPSDSETTESSIWTCIKTLRQKMLHSFGIAPIKTVAGFGYKLEV